MRFSLSTVRTTSKFDPSGDQSAHSTLSSTSRGAVPAVSGVRANVPNAPEESREGGGLQRNRDLSVRGDADKIYLTESDGPRFNTVLPRGEEFRILSTSRRTIDDRAVVGRKRTLSTVPLRNVSW
jgi:hypothetical protein